jgi:hypothetical protein
MRHYSLSKRLEDRRQETEYRIQETEATPYHENTKGEKHERREGK